MNLKIMIVAAAMALSGAVAAGPMKCKDANGRTIYSDTQCLDKRKDAENTARKEREIKERAEAAKAAKAAAEAAAKEAARPKTAEERRAEATMRRMQASKEAAEYHRSCENGAMEACRRYNEAMDKWRENIR